MATFGGRNVIWLLGILVVLFESDLVQADFGLPTSISGVRTISSNVRAVDRALSSLTQNFRRIKWSGQSERFRDSSEIIAQIAYKLTDLGRYVTGNVSKVANDKSSPVKELFTKLHDSFDGMSQYLEKDVADSTGTLSLKLGFLPTSELVQALSGVYESVMNATNVSDTIGQAVDNAIQITRGKPLSRATVNVYISPTLTTSMSTALNQMKDQTVELSRTIEGTLKNIANTDSYLAKINSTDVSTEQKLTNLGLTVTSQGSTEKDNILRRYYASLDATRSELSSVIEKLSTVFGSNRFLQTLGEQYTDAFIKIVDYLYQRNRTDSATITDMFNQTTLNITQQLEAIRTNISSGIHQGATKLANIILSRSISSNAENCLKNLENQVFKGYDNYISGITNCLSKEKSRLARVPDAVDRILRLVQENAQDFTANIATCFAYSNFESSPLAFQQAQACLHTNLNHMADFQSTISQEYDALVRVCRLETEGIKFRVENCLTTRVNETRALVNNLNAEAEQCTSEQLRIRTKVLIRPVEEEVAVAVNDDLEQIIVMPTARVEVSTVMNDDDEVSGKVESSTVDEAL